jgi:heme-degrading monooxygenase HmoA
MENRPIITLTGTNRAAGADPAIFQRYRKWSDEVYSPLLNREQKYPDNDWYELCRENPEYPERVHILHYRTLEAREAYSGTAIYNDIERERKSWHERGIVDYIWTVTLALIQSFRSQPLYISENSDTRIENAPIMHLEAYRLSREEQEQYLKWFREYGGNVFLPIFMKFPGLRGYDFYQEFIAERQYPQFLSVIYFERMEAYQDFLKSPELAGFQKSLKSVFRRRLTYEWYVQYRLVKSWRK